MADEVGSEVNVDPRLYTGLQVLRMLELIFARQLACQRPVFAGLNPGELA
jgi:hypothetical protein